MMSEIKLSNFKLLETRGKSILDRQYIAEVLVTTTSGMLFWKKVTAEYHKIRREYIGFWHFVDTGEYTPGDQAENLARAWKAKTGQEC